MHFQNTAEGQESLLDGSLFQQSQPQPEQHPQLSSYPSALPPQQYEGQTHDDSIVTEKREDKPTRGGSGPSLVFDERVHGRQDLPSLSSFPPSATPDWEISLGNVNLGIANEGIEECTPTILVGGLAFLLIFAVTGILLFVWQFYPLNTALMVITCLLGLLSGIVYCFAQILKSPSLGTRLPFEFQRTTYPPLDVRETLYSLHLRLFVLVNAFFFVVNHLDFLQSHMQTLKTLYQYQQDYQTPVTVSSCTDLMCSVDVAAMRTVNFHVALYYPWFLIPLLIWGVGFLAHTLVHFEKVRVFSCLIQSSYLLLPTT